MSDAKNKPDASSTPLLFVWIFVLLGLVMFRGWEINQVSRRLTKLQEEVAVMKQRSATVPVREETFK